MNLKKILVIRLSSLGDILHAAPALRSLRRAYPEARIDWLVEDRMQFLVRSIPGVGEVLSLDTRTVRRRWWDGTAWQELLATLRGLRARGYDCAIDFQGLIKSGVLAWVSGAPLRIGFSGDLVREKPATWFYTRTLPRPASEQHVARLNLALASLAGGIGGDLGVPLDTPTVEREAIERRLEAEKLSDFVVINPGGGWPTKRWSPEKYGALAARITNELKLEVVITTGPGEDDLYHRIRAAFPATSTLGHFSVPFLQMVPLFGKAKLFIGGDTGPLHLACALGTPVVGIFGPTSPVRNGPFSIKDEAVVHPLECSFCYGRTCPTRNECMDISVDEVLAAVRRRLGRSA